MLGKKGSLERRFRSHLLLQRKSTMAIAPTDGIGGPGVSQVDDERLVRELGMSIAPGGVAYVASELRLENGHTALPELIAMSGGRWRMWRAPCALLAVEIRARELDAATSIPARARKPRRD
jgi:hypothetical protein